MCVFNKFQNHRQISPTRAICAQTNRGLREKLDGHSAQNHCRDLCGKGRGLPLPCDPHRGETELAQEHHTGGVEGGNKAETPHTHTQKLDYYKVITGLLWQKL